MMIRDIVVMDQGVKECCNHILQHISHQQSFAWVLTLNPEIWVHSHQSSTLRTAIQSAKWVTIDGIGIGFLRWVSGLPWVPRITGVDLVCQLAKTPLTIAMVGASEEVVRAAAQCLHAMGGQVVMVHHGFFDSSADARVITQLVACKPDLVFVGMGSPRQDAFILALADHLSHGVAMGVGGVFDVLAGTVQRAPRWMQQSGTEWLWRIIQQPARLHRMGRMIGPFLRDCYKGWLSK